MQACQGVTPFCKQVSNHFSAEGNIPMSDYKKKMNDYGWHAHLGVAPSTKPSVGDQAILKMHHSCTILIKQLIIHCQEVIR